MTTPVRTAIPKTQKQQNYNGSRKVLHATRNRMVEATPQNAYPSTSLQAMTQRAYQPFTVRGIDDHGSDHQYQFTSQNAYKSPQKRVAYTSGGGALVPAEQNRYGVSPRKQKEEDMARKRMEMQDQLNRDAQDSLKKKKEKEQKKREEYIMRHKFMYPDLFGGHKLGSDNCENLYENLQAEIYTVTVDPATLRTQQEEARRKMQEEYDTKARKHAEKMKEIEATKRAQQAELAAKMKAEADKYKVGRLNTTADGNTHTNSDCAAVKLNENEATRKTQDQLHKIGLQNSSCTKIKTNCHIQVKKPEKQEFDKDDIESHEELELHHYKCGRPPVVPTLKLRPDPAKNTVNKRSDEELTSADTISKVEEESVSYQISSVKKGKPVDTEKDFREEMRRARLKMQEVMNLKVQEFLGKSEQESD